MQELDLNQFVFVLGAPDPEMQTIDCLVSTLGIDVVYAMNDGKRVFPSNAYTADAVHDSVGNKQIVFVECQCAGEYANAIVIDHHRPGDPGYGVACEQFWDGSSIGQVAKLIGVRQTTHLSLVAAADHCLADAYAGRCPGIDPDELQTYRMQTRAKAQNRTVSDVQKDVQQAKIKLTLAPVIQIAGVSVADCRGQTIPELPEAAARMQTPFISDFMLTDGRIKVGLMSAPQNVVQTWMQTCGLNDLYGDPARGYAGGFYQP